MDPEVPLTGAARAQSNAVITDLHEAPRVGTEVAAKLTALHTEVTRVAPLMDSSSTPAAITAEFAAFRAPFDSLRATFGVGVAVAGFGGGEGGGGAAAAAQAKARGS